MSLDASFSKLDASASPTPSSCDSSALARDFGADLTALVDNLERVILGKREALKLCVVALLAEGHILLEDVPGTGKTTLAKALARSVDVNFKRIQFTSDLLPSDVVGVSTHSASRERFEFQAGPIFANIVLADELNRSSPRTQSALLESMNEGRVSVDGQTRELPRPFLVVATQNPIEFEGTYPLPESQLDRFLVRVRLGYPTESIERDLMRSRMIQDPLDNLQAVASGECIAQASEFLRRVRIEDELLDYAIAVLNATRQESEFLLGASPRAGLAWSRAAQALALVEGRDYCVPDDFKAMAVPVLAHRVVPIAPSPDHRADLASDTAVLEVLGRVPCPV